MALSRMREGGASAAFRGRVPATEYLGTLEFGEAQSVDSGTRAESVARRRPSVGPETLLDALIPHTAATDTPVPVVDEDDRLLGAVDPQRGHARPRRPERLKPLSDFSLNGV